MDEDWEADVGVCQEPDDWDSQIPEFLRNSASFCSDAHAGFERQGDPLFGGSNETETAPSFGFGGPVTSFDDLPDDSGFGGESQSGFHRENRGQGRGRGWGRGRGRGRGGGGDGGDRGGSCYNFDGPVTSFDDLPDDSGFGRENRGRGCGRGWGRDRGGGGGGSQGGSCYNCGKEGHISRNCPNEKTDSRRDRLDSGDSFGNKVTDLQEPERPAPIFFPKDIAECDLFDMGVKTGVNFEAYSSIPVKVTGEGPIPEPALAFEEMNLRKVLLDNVRKAEFPTPTPIQKHAIPILSNKRDLMACAQTGSGKTAAFLLPMLHYILENDVDSHSYEDVAQPVGLVLAPTRELAAQIFQESRKFSLHTVAKNSCIYGGVATHFQLRRLKEQGCHIMIATPGKLLFFLGIGKISLKSLKFLVFDEADRMLDLGFIDDMEKLVANPDMPPKGERQTMMFSATFPEEVQQCALRFLDNYLFLVVGQVGAANKDVCQTIVNVPKFQKRDKLIEYLNSFGDQEKILVFVELKRQADFVGTYLSTNGFRSATLHGGRYQEQREEALSAFRSDKYRVLVATSVAARGLDIRGVGYVINYDLPKSAEEYVHRIGRTGRVGNRGEAVSFYDPEQDYSLAKDLVRILKDAEQEVPSWLSTAAQGGDHGATYFGSGQFASADIRGQNDGTDDVSITHLGGPVTQEDEVWGD